MSGKYLLNDLTYNKDRVFVGNRVIRSHKNMGIVSKRISVFFLWKILSKPSNIYRLG